MVDATPDFGEQMAALSKAAGRPSPSVDELVLTHAHIGHYLGLALLGREVVSADRVPVRCTPSMAAFLRSNRPWSHLVDRNEIEIETVAPGSPIEFGGVTINVFLTPHRAEDSDTIGLELTGRDRTLIYMPDTDTFSPSLIERVCEADVALVDGTFYGRDELPHREILTVKHPFVQESVKQLANAKGDVRFIHINHTNLLLRPGMSTTLPDGFGVAREGDSFDL